MFNKKAGIIFVFLLVFCAGLFFWRWYQSAKPTRPNLVFITLDALRPDHLGAYGYKRATSPNIDALAGQGARFTQAISQASWTEPSIVSIVSSVYPKHEGFSTGYGIGPDDNSIISVLKKNGYRTYFIGNAKPVLTRTLGGQRGFFDVFYNRYMMGPDVALADQLVDTVMTRVPVRSKEPFFLWLYIYDTHSPYEAGKDFPPAFSVDNLHPKMDIPINPDDGSLASKHFGIGSIPRFLARDNITDTRFYIARYDGALKFADAQIGRLLKWLRQKSMLNNTLVVIFADHGESLTEHNLYFSHSYSIYDTLIKVPLIMVYPGKIIPGIINQQVQMVDLVPTVLSLLGASSPSLRWEGQTLEPFLTGNSVGAREYAFAETAFPPAPQTIRTSQWKLIHNREGDTYELYDLHSDPGEKNNLAAVKPVLVKDLGKKLADWANRSAGNFQYQLQPYSQEDKQKLRSLGYLQ